MGKLIGAGLLAVVVLAGLIFGGWQAGWWFKTQNTNRQAHLYRHSYENQQTLRDQITSKIGDYEQVHATAPDSAWERGILNIICADADKVTGDALPADQQQFMADNCAYGEAR